MTQALISCSSSRLPHGLPPTQAKELVHEEFYQQKRTSRLQVTTLMRLLQLLQRDVSPEEDAFLPEGEDGIGRSIDRHQERQEVSFCPHLLPSLVLLL